MSCGSFLLVEPAKLKTWESYVKMDRTMAKTITIRDDLYEKLRVLKGDASLNDFLEHLLGEGEGKEKGIELLRKLRKTLEFRSEEKDTILREIYAKQEEKRAFDNRPGY